MDHFMTNFVGEPSQDIMTLAHWISGEFSNSNQSEREPQKFAHIHIFFRPLAPFFFNGDSIGFYSEQFYDYDPWSPYRQGIHRLEEQGDSIYIENYGLKDPILYAGAGRELEILKTITPTCIERRWHCSMLFHREGDHFIGKLEGKQCYVQRHGHQTYLESQVILTESTWIGADKGYDIDSHEHIWGAENGPLHFQKVQDFSHELQCDAQRLK
jgi:CpeT protein